MMQEQLGLVPQTNQQAFSFGGFKEEARSIVGIRRIKPGDLYRKQIGCKCSFCGKEFWGTLTGGRKSQNQYGPKYCSEGCSNLGINYGTQEKYTEIGRQAVCLAEKHVDAKEICRRLGVSYCAIKRLLTNHYGSALPKYAIALRMYNEGKTTAEIANHFQTSKGCVATWLMSVSPEIRKSYEEQKKHDLKVIREEAASAIRLYRKHRSFHDAARATGGNPHTLRNHAVRSGVWKRRYANKQLGNEKTKTRRLRLLSKKYESEKQFNQHFANRLRTEGNKVQQEKPYSGSRRTDLFVVSESGQKYVVELKTETKARRFANGSVQPMAAAAILGGTPMLVYPSDTDVHQSALEDIRLAFGGKLLVMNEDEAASFISVGDPGFKK